MILHIMIIPWALQEIKVVIRETVGTRTKNVQMRREVMVTS